MDLNNCAAIYDFMRVLGVLLVALGAVELIELNYLLEQREKPKSGGPGGGK